MAGPQSQFDPIRPDPAEPQGIMAAMVFFDELKGQIHDFVLVPENADFFAGMDGIANGWGVGDIDGCCGERGHGGKNDKGG